MPQKFLAATNITNGLSVWPWDENYPTGFGTVFGSPASALVNYSTGSYTPRFNSNGSALLCATQGSPYVQGYQFSSSGLGTKYSNPATLPSVSTGLSFGNDSEVFVSGSSGQFMWSYPFSSSSGFGARYFAASSQSARSVIANSTSVFFSTVTSPFIVMYPRTNPGFGTKFANPGVLPGAPSTAAASRGSSIGLSSTDVIVSQATTPFYSVYPWTAVGGFGTKYTTPSLGAPTSGLSVAFNKTGTAVAVGGSAGTPSAYFRVAPWTTGTGPGTAYSNPSSLPASNICSIVFDTASIAVTMQSTNYLSAWQFDTTTGFGNKYSDSVGGYGGYSVGLGQIPTAISMTANVALFALTGIAS